MTDIDFSEDAPVIDQAALGRVSTVAQQLVDAQDDVADLEETLKRRKADVVRLEQFELPEVMTEVGMKEFKLTSGHQITVKDVVAGSIPKSNFDEGVEWLRSHDHGGIVKLEVGVIVQFGKGKEKQAEEFLAYLNSLPDLKQKYGGTPHMAPSIHYMTFGAWARELYKLHLEDHTAEGENSKDEDCPFCDEERQKKLGIFVGKKAEVKVEKGINGNKTTGR